MLKLEQISLKVGFDEHDIKKSCDKLLRIGINKIEGVKLLRVSIDARKKPDIKYVATVGVTLKDELEKKFKHFYYEDKEYLLNYKSKKTNKKVVVVGFGPSGMFSALALARMGLSPIIVEQGKKVDEREVDVKNFWENGKLDRFSNVQFGEGGAGTFSDGKLNTNLSNDYCKIVVNEFHRFGAPKEITYINKPHIGSDNLKVVVKNIREEIIKLGGTFLFSHKLIDVDIKDNAVKSVVLKNLVTDTEKVIDCDYLLLCVGHSARDVFKLLYDKGVIIKQKPFAMGVRIEQKQSDINLSQYGQEKIDGLPNADYKLVEHLPNGRSVFTFCMCPGGQVVASSTGDGEIVTNGMSLFARDKENANSAVLVNVKPSDFGSDYALAGVEFQEKYEKLAFKLGGGNFKAPAESVGSFVYGKENKTSLNYTYRPNITYAKIKDCLPDFVTESLKIGLPLLNKKLRNFAKDDNLLIAIESRTSSPITMQRDENFESNIKGIFPVGEGAGFAGGIVSSAQDGIKVAEKIYERI